MKKSIYQQVLAVWILIAASTGRAALFSWTGTQAIPDYPASGLAYSFNFNNPGLSEITDVTVSLNISGGWNGDLYAYLSHGDGFVVLLNRVGAGTGTDGYGNSGFNITLQTGGANGDIHLYGGGSVPTGSYEADGRADYTSATRNNTLATLNDLNPNGSWTLFFADLSPESTSTLNSWGVSISAVPEPIEWALGIFAAAAILAKAFQMYRARLHRRVRRFSHVPVA